MVISRPGFDGEPITNGFVMWSSASRFVQVVDLPVNALDPLDAACVPRLVGTKPLQPSARMSLQLPALVSAVRVDESSSRAAVGCVSGSLSVWSCTTGCVEHVMEKLPGPASALCWAASRWLVAGMRG